MFTDKTDLILSLSLCLLQNSKQIDIGTPFDSNIRLVAVGFCIVQTQEYSIGPAKERPVFPRLFLNVGFNLIMSDLLHTQD